MASRAALVVTSVGEKGILYDLPLRKTKNEPDAPTPSRMLRSGPPYVADSLQRQSRS